MRIETGFHFSIAHRERETGRKAGPAGGAWAATLAGMVQGAHAVHGHTPESPWASLPDWSGDWVVEPAKDPPPPYNAPWAAKRRDLLAAIRSGKAADPFDAGGLPAGAPRMMGLGGVHEWILRPGEVWHAVENGKTVQRIFTDGRGHRQGDELSATYNGDNVGRWEGPTLVIDTVGLRGDTWLGPGLPHSDRTHVTTRIRRVGRELVARIRIDDPAAFTRPWRLVRRYRRLPEDSFLRHFVGRTPGAAQEAGELH
jgi:hypothetical protein